MKTKLKYLVLACLITGIATLGGCEKEPGTPILDTAAVSGITVNTAVVISSVISDGGTEVLSRGICWNTAPNPTITDNVIAAGAGSGSFTGTITGLEPNTAYYVRAFAKNSNGISYSLEITFSTGQASLATLTTSEVVSVKATKAVAGGNITSDGGSQITARGVCWSTDPEPTTGNGVTIFGTGSGVYTHNINELTPNTTYYVRAYATNSAGTSYGNEVSFITSMPIPPSLTTFFVDATPTTAMVGGIITDKGDGIGEIIERGVCWSTNQLPTIDDEHLSAPMGTDEFTVNLINLNRGTIYFARAYAVTSTGVFYGSQESFSPNWSEGIFSNDFPGRARFNAVSFAIGTRIYMGLGRDYSDDYSFDFWEWDQATELWTSLAWYPGTGADDAVGFSIGEKGYVVAQNELWEYDPSKNTWTQKATLPGDSKISSAVCFSIGTKGYFGLGYTSSFGGWDAEFLTDFWEWDQETDVWTKKADFEGSGRASAVGFSIGNRGYIGTGSVVGYRFNDFWEWDQSTDKWTQKADFPGTPRTGAVGFSIGTKGYIGTGSNGSNTSNLLKDFWEWDRASNTWTRVNDFQGGPRYEAAVAVIGSNAYIGTGYGYMPDPYFRDFWRYDP